MGALLCPSKSLGQYQSSSSAQLATQLGISDATLTKLERVFSAIDFDGSGEVDVGEFLAFFELKRTKFSKRVFSVIRCKKYSDDWLLLADLRITCFEGTHAWFMPAITLPMLVFWVIGIPVAGFLLVRHFRSQNRLDEAKIALRFSFL